MKPFAKELWRAGADCNSGISGSPSLSRLHACGRVERDNCSATGEEQASEALTAYAKPPSISKWMLWRVLLMALPQSGWEEEAEDRTREVVDCLRPVLGPAPGKKASGSRT